MYATISMHWNDAARTLTIGNCKGSYPGMLKDRIFKVIVVNEQQGIGAGESSGISHKIRYNGKAIKQEFK
jgi:alpha-D-xyloside xylohydrolase